MAEQPVLLLAMDETSGSLVHDTSGNGITAPWMPASSNGSIPWANPGIAFSGGRGINVDAISSVFGGAFTVMFRVVSPEVPVGDEHHEYLSHGSGPSDEDVRVMLFSGQGGNYTDHYPSGNAASLANRFGLGFYAGGYHTPVATSASRVSWDVGREYHVTASWSLSGGAKIYVDGVLEESGAIGGVRGTSVSALTKIGCESLNDSDQDSPGNHQIRAVVRDYRVYASQLSDSDVATLAAGGELLPDPPSTPTGFALDIASSAIGISWGLMAGADSYTLQRSTDNLTWATIATPTGSSPSYMDTHTVVAVRYFYRVKATNTGGDSAFATVDGLSQGPLSALAGVPTRQQLLDLVASGQVVSYRAQSGFRLLKTALDIPADDATIQSDYTIYQTRADVIAAVPGMRRGH
jgi:hypothetical protein